MVIKHQLVVIYIMCSICIQLSSCNLYSEYASWTPRHPPRKDNIYCPKTCNDSSVKDPDTCCLCESVHQWELANTTDADVLYLLEVEYISVHFNANLTVNPNCTCVSQLSTSCMCASPNDANFQGVFHRDGNLRSFPLNLCDFPRLTHIDFVNNQIARIADVRCLLLLDSLILDENVITHLSNQTFIGMTNLRVVSLIHNRISTPDIKLFSAVSVGIFKFDISQNDLRKYDLTNIFVEEYDFCLQNISNNNFETTDETDFYLNSSLTYNSGDVDFSGVDRMFDPLSSMFYKQPEMYALLGKVIPKGTYSFSDGFIECDCTIGYLLQMSKDEFVRYNTVRSTFCGGPESLKGFDILDVYKNRSLIELFTCNHTSDELCPEFCRCTELSSYQYMMIDCRNMQKYELPKYLPGSRSGYPYALRMDDNYVRTLPNQQYFTSLHSLDMSNNAITHLSDDILNNLETMTLLNVSGHSLVELPKRIQTVKIERIYFGHNPVPCNCDNLWIGEWRRRWNAGLENPLYCQLDGGEVKLADYVTDSYLECGSSFSLAKVIVSISGAILFTSLCLLVFYFKYELVVIMKKIRSQNKINVPFEWDCYISIDEEDPGLREFVLKDLKPKLARAGFKIFVPCTDLPVGGVIENDIKNSLYVSKCFLFILTKDYGLNESTEYNIARQLFTQQPSRIIIILNYDNMPISSFKIPRLRSLKRFSHYIEVVDRQRNIFNDITTILGTPLFMCDGAKCRDEMHNMRTVHK